MPLPGVQPFCVACLWWRDSRALAHTHCLGLSRWKVGREIIVEAPSTLIAITAFVMCGLLVVHKEQMQECDCCGGQPQVGLCRSFFGFGHPSFCCRFSASWSPQGSWVLAVGTLRFVAPPTHPTVGAAVFAWHGSHPPHLTIHRRDSRALAHTHCLGLSRWKVGREIIVEAPSTLIAITAFVEERTVVGVRQGGDGGQKNSNK